MINQPEISLEMVWDLYPKLRTLQEPPQIVLKVHREINQDLVARAHSFTQEGQEPTQEMWDLAYEQIYREEILMEDDEDWDPGWTGPKMYFGAPPASTSKPEILRSTIAHVLTATNKTSPTFEQVTAKHAELNKMIRDTARSLAIPGEEPTAQMWQQAYEEVLHSEINIPMQEWDDDEDDQPWSLSPEQLAQIEAEVEAEAEALAKMTDEERAEHVYQKKLTWLRDDLRIWLSRQPDVQLGCEHVFEETLNVLWQTILKEVDLSRTERYSTLLQRLEQYLDQRFPPRRGWWNDPTTGNL